MRPGGGRLRRRAGAAGQRRRLPRRVAADRKAGRRRPFAHDPRREGRHPACAVEILVGGRSAPGHSRGVVHRRPSRHPPRGPVGRMGIRMTHRHSLITISATNYTIQLKRHTRNVSNRCPHLAASRWRTGTGMTVQCHGKE